jgi:hypothetical protein
MRQMVAGITFVVIAIFAVSILGHELWSKVISLEVAVSVAAALTTGLSVLFLSLQVFHQARLSQGQLIEALSQDVDENVNVEIDLDEGGPLNNPVEELTREQLTGIISFLTFFERLNTIVELDLVPLRIFNELYGYRFFLILHNPNVQKHVLLKESMKESWSCLFRLHKRWVKYRRANKMRIPWEERLRDLEADAFYQAS